MKSESIKNPKGKTQASHWKGYWSLGCAAKELGVHYTHLFRVLAGSRSSKSLRARYAALRRKRQAEGYRMVQGDNYNNA